MPISVAIVEDDLKASEALTSHLERFGRENSIHFRIQVFQNAILLLDHYTADYDLIYMDIQMPMMNGMDAARCLRDLDSTVALIFVTSLTQYAIQGYEVSAMDYIVKPFNYYDFALKMTRVLKRIPTHDGEDIMIPTPEGTVRLSLDHIKYVEVQGHHVIYHTLNGDYTHYSTMTKAEQQLGAHHFVRCNSCYLVNLQYVKGIRGMMVQVGDDELKISQPKKKGFCQAVEAYTNRNRSSI